MDYLIKNWVLSGAIIIVGYTLIFLLKTFFAQLLLALKDIRQELINLRQTTTIQDIKLTNIDRENLQAHERANRHSNRITDLEKHIISINDVVSNLTRKP